MRGACAAAIAAVLLFCGFVGIASPLNAEGAAELVVERIVPPLTITSEHIAFLYPRPIDEADELPPYAPAPIPAEADRLPYLCP